MSDTSEWPLTAQAVKEMMTEVCDKNLFDSGGTYGYAYERRANCDKEPEFKIHYELLDNGKLCIEVTKSMYWHLVNTCQYRHDLTVMLDAYADLKDERYGAYLGEDFSLHLVSMQALIIHATSRHFWMVRFCSHRRTPAMSRQVCS